MSYLVLARKWRPKGFQDLVGQDHIVNVLSNSIEQSKVAHAYVFSGPRGVGKTSTARIYTKALNCAEGPTVTPCGKCPSCMAIAEGSSVDVIEIDGASNNSVDDIRDLRERVKYAPAGGKYKAYIIDEAHMLSTAAFNALLKTLEEPPPHVIFIMATTESRKIPLTVLSRCQHLPFRRVSMQGIRDRLKFIAGQEGIPATDGALALIARAADGSIRDSLTILDQVASFSGEINETSVRDLLDVADFQALINTASAVIDGDRSGIVAQVASLVDYGTDLRAFVRDLIKLFRDLLVMKIVPEGKASLDLSAEELAAAAELATKVSEEHIALVVSELVKSENDVRTSFAPRIALEMALMKASYLSTFRSVSEAIAALSERGASAPPPSAPSPRPVSKSLPPAAPAPKAVMEPPSPVTEDEPPLTEPPVEMVEMDEAPYDDAPAVTSFTGPSLHKAIMGRLKDPRLSSKLATAAAELMDNTLHLHFSSSDAVICAKPFQENRNMLEEHATALRGVPTKVEITIKNVAPSGSRKELKNKVMSEPIVKEALDLFEGRIVHIKKTGE